MWEILSSIQQWTQYKRILPQARHDMSLGTWKLELRRNFFCHRVSSRTGTSYLRMWSRQTLTGSESYRLWVIYRFWVFYRLWIYYRLWVFNILKYWAVLWKKKKKDTVLSRIGWIRNGAFKVQRTFSARHQQVQLHRTSRPTFPQPLRHRGWIAVSVVFGD